MEQVKVDAIGAKPLQAALAGGGNASPRCVRRQNLADNENSVALPGDRLTDQFLGAAVAVHFGGVDQSYAEINAAFEGGDGFRLMSAALAHHPGAQAERRHRLATRQGDGFHRLASAAAMNAARIRAVSAGN